MKSVLVSKPAKAELCESQSGAETMPAFAFGQPSASPVCDLPAETNHSGRRTILEEDVQALPDKQVVVEHDETEREREHIVASPDLEKLANSPLFAQQHPLALSSRDCMEARNPASRPWTVKSGDAAGYGGQMNRWMEGWMDGRLSRDGHCSPDPASAPSRGHLESSPTLCD